MKVSKGTLFKRKNSPYLYLNISVDGKRYIQKTKYYHNELDNVKKDILPYLRQKILNGEIKTPGVQLPITKEVYNPILKELEDYGVIFKEKEVPFLGYNPENVAG